VKEVTNFGNNFTKLPAMVDTGMMQLDPFQNAWLLHCCHCNQVTLWNSQLVHDSKIARHTCKMVLLAHM